MSTSQLLLLSALVWSHVSGQVPGTDAETECVQRCAQCDAGSILRDGLCICVADNGEERQCEGGVRRVRCLGMVGSTRGALTGLLGAGLHNLTARERAQEFRKRVEALRSFAFLGRQKPKQEEKTSDSEKTPPSSKSYLPVSPFLGKSLGVKGNDDPKSKETGEEELVGAPNPTDVKPEPQQQTNKGPDVTTGTAPVEGNKSPPILPAKFPIFTVERQRPAASGRVLRSSMPSKSVQKPPPVIFKPTILRPLETRTRNSHVARSRIDVKKIAEGTTVPTQDRKQKEKSVNSGLHDIIIHTYISPST